MAQAGLELLGPSHPPAPVSQVTGMTDSPTLSKAGLPTTGSEHASPSLCMLVLSETTSQQSPSPGYRVWLPAVGNPGQTPFLPSLKCSYACQEQLSKQWKEIYQAPREATMVTIGQGLSRS